MLTEAEARAYLSASPSLPSLREPCSCDPAPTDVWFFNSQKRPRNHCRYCGGSGEAPRDWHVWEDLILAMEAKGWNAPYENHIWSFDKPNGQPFGVFYGADANPIIAAALALQQEAQRCLEC